MIRIHRIHYPVTVLGPGRRIGIWLQGCSLACPGCASSRTWDSHAGESVNETALAGQCRCWLKEGIDGITITGGEPFEQAASLELFLDAIQDWRRIEKVDVLCYSGMPLKVIEQKFSKLLSRLDAIIPEPYLKDLPTRSVWRGSGNQPLVLLSALAQERYASLPSGAPASQLVMINQKAQLIGIPREEEMTKMQKLAAERGFTLQQDSLV